MSSTAFAGIQAVIIAALSESPALAGGNISANKTRPIPTSQSAAIVVRAEKTSAVETALGALDWDTEYAIECYARGISGTDPQASVDDLLHSAWARVAVLTDAQIGGNLRMLPQVDWFQDATDVPDACAVIRVSVRHRTPTASLTAW